MDKIRENKILATLLIGGALLLVLTVRGQQGNFNEQDKLMAGAGNPAFESPHERSSYVLMLSILYNKTVSLTTSLADFGFNDVGYHNGKLYSLFPPGVALTLIPLYLFGSLFGYGQIFAYSTVLLVTLATMFFLFKISCETFRLPKWVAVVPAFIFVFGTTAWSYSVTIYQHIFTTFLILAGFYAIYRFRQKGEWKWAVAGSFAYGISVFFDYTNLVLLFPIIIYLSISLRRLPNISRKTIYFFPIILLLVSFLVPVIYNTCVFGDWKTLSNPLPVYKRATVEEINSTNSAGQALSRFHAVSFPQGIDTLLISYQSGLFVFSPILLLGLLFILVNFKKKKMYLETETMYFIGIIVLNVFIYSIFDDPRGGWSYGPRYMIPSMACFSLFVGQWLSHISTTTLSLRIKKVILLVFFCVSSATALLGVLGTNMVPDKDSVYISSLPHGIIYNWHALTIGRIGSFMYNEFFQSIISPVFYTNAIYLVVICIFVYLLKKI